MLLNTEYLRLKMWRYNFSTLERATLVYMQQHVTIIFEMIREESLSWKNKRLFACFGQELTFNILYFMKTPMFP